MSKSKENSELRLLRTITKIGQAVSQSLDIKEILKLTCEMTAGVLSADRCSIAMQFNEDSFEIVQSYLRKSSYPSIVGVSFNLREYPNIAPVLLKGKTVHIFDPKKIRLSTKERRIFAKIKIKVFLSVPIMVESKIIGAVILSRVEKSEPFSSLDLCLCETITNQVGIAIKNANLLKDLECRYELQKNLLDISNTIFKKLDLNLLLEIATQKITNLLGVERCSAVLFDETRSRSVLYKVYQEGKHRPEYENIQRISADFPVVFRELGRKKMFCTSDIYKSALTVKEKRIFEKEGFKSLLIVPITLRSENVGLLSLSTLSKHYEFTKSEIELFKSIANQISMALENTKLVKTLKEEHEELRVSRQEAQLANERLRYLLFSTSAVIYSAKASGDYEATFITDNVRKMVGYSPEKFIKYSSFWIDHIHPEDVQRILQELPNIFKKGYHTYEYRFRCKNGKYIWVRDEMKLIRNDKGQPLEILGYWIDITDRKNAEIKIIESENRYRRLFEDSPISLWEEDFSTVKNYLDSLKSSGVKDLRAYFDNRPEEIAKCSSMVKVVAVNQTTLKWYQVKNINELKFGLNRIFTKESYEVFKEGLIAITSGKTNFESDAINQTLKGGKMDINIRWSVVSGYERSLSRLLVSIVDITERKLAEKQLTVLANRVMEAQEEERRRTSQKLHDSIVQDLVAIKLDLKMCLHTSPEEYVQIISRLKDDEKLLTQTMENLSDLSSDLRPRILDELGLFSALSWYVDKFRRRTNLKVQLKITGSKKRLAPQSEIGIFRIIQEGLTNIAKHSEAESASLSLSAKAGYVRIVIQDNGIGFEPERAYTPTSYGLLRMIENTKLLGGKFKVISKKGEGTTLHITIPY